MILPSYFDVNIYELQGGFHGFRLMLTQNPWVFPSFFPSKPFQSLSGAAASAGRSRRLHQGECLGGGGAGRPFLGKPWATHGYAATQKLMVVDDQLTMV